MNDKTPPLPSRATGGRRPATGLLSFPKIKCYGGLAKEKEHKDVMATSITNDIKKLQIENKRLESIIDVQMNTVTDCRNRERRINALLAKLPYPI